MFGFSANLCIFRRTCRSTQDKMNKQSQCCNNSNNRQLSLKQIPHKGPQTLRVPRKVLFVQRYDNLDHLNKTGTFSAFCIQNPISVSKFAEQMARSAAGMLLSKNEILLKHNVNSTL